MERAFVRWLPLLVAMQLGAACTSKTADRRPPSEWTASSADRRFVGTLRPESGPPKIGQHQNWVLRLTDDDGGPVYPARIGVNGGMPGHGHGLPSKPEVTEHLGEGRYRIEGMLFNMAGAWTLLFVIETPQARDRLQFELEVDW